MFRDREDVDITSVQQKAGGDIEEIEEVRKDGYKDCKGRYWEI